MPEAPSQKWLTERFDKLEDQMDRDLRDVKRELLETRHAQRGSIDQIAVQVAALVVQMNTLANSAAQVELWRSEGGPLDSRFNRHDERIRLQDSWRNRMAGAIAILAILFPVTVAALAQALR